MNNENRNPTPSEPVASRPHMPGYGLPEGTEGLLPWSWAESRLARSHGYWLATTRPDGRPHLMPIWGIWLDRVFYFSTGRHSRKARNLESNAYCVVANDEAREAVVVEGVAHELMDTPLRRQLVSLMEKKYDYDMSSMVEDIVSLREPIYAVRPRTIFGLDEETTLQAATRWHFP
jgi:nitroimidazol reductase NimA-like FMN-containing flavoprotein (pyridoxamine 5'-phosphate oxidase superfamily)